MSVLYALVCGSPAASGVGTLVDLAQRRGWDVWVATTPGGRTFIDPALLAVRTGHPVLSSFADARGHGDVLPPADAIVMAPATVNTLNKWAMGIADTLPLALVIEAYGLAVPVVAVPYTNSAMAAIPALHTSVRRLRDWG